MGPARRRELGRTMAHQQRDNALLAHQALMKGCVFSGGPTAPAAPLLYLLKREPSKAAILTDLDNASIRRVLAAAGPLRLVWLGFASVTDDATFRVKIAADEAAMDTDTLLYDSRVAGVDQIGSARCRERGCKYV